METTYDIVMREDDFVLYANGKILLSEHANEVSHSNARLLRFAITQGMLSPHTENYPLELLLTLTDVLSGSKQLFDFNIGDAVKSDPLLSCRHNSAINLKGEIFSENTNLVDFIFLNSSSLASSLNNFLLNKEEEQIEQEYIIAEIQNLTTEQKLVLNALATKNGNGIVIHHLLIKGFLSIAEYTAGLLVLKLRGCQHEVQKIIDPTIGASAFQQQITNNASLVLDFLTLCKSENRISVIEEIIERGEDNQTEFKSTLRWDLRQAIKNAVIEHASLKTICAFLNSEGGDLLIGVRDDGSIEGIETDQFDNDDRFLLHLWTLIKTCMGQEVVEWVKTSLQKFGDKTVCRVNCKKAQKPIFLNQKGFDEAFFIRVGPSSSNLEISSALKYIEQHFK